MMNLFPDAHFALPAWVPEYTWPGQILSSEDDRLAVAVELSKQQVLRGTGGPFGAVICELVSGRVVGAGVNLVVPTKLSILHAEVVAWSIAQQVMDAFDLGAKGSPALGLYSSAQPCIACWGGLFWTGIKRLAFAATKDDVEKLAGFDEGPMPDDWLQRLQAYGISVHTSQRESAAAALALYAGHGGKIYNAT
jgi:tRNA(Arg) A34 adenosine deaminase TadA